MSAQPERHLQPVDEKPKLIVLNPATGEQVGLLDDVTQALEDTIAGLQRDIRGWTTRHGDLKRDKEGEAREHPVWPAALRVFDHWKVVCKHPRSEWSLDRFELIRPWLEKLSAKKKGRPEDPAERLKFAEAMCKLAVDGIAFDPYCTRRKNGTTKRHDGWHLIFENADRFEERCNAAPMERIREVVGTGTVKEAVTGKAEKRESPQATLDQAQAAE